AGVQVAPAIGTILADTLAQAGGNFVAYISLSCDSPANDIADMIVARRNAANNADIWLFHVATATGNVPSSPILIPLHVVLAVNERLVVRVSGKNVAAGVSALANIWLGPG
ncbi:MAG: hypothetical protein ACHQKY_17805, partial [Terriglobia bacterium]